MIVEDDADIRQLLAVTLESEGYGIVQAENGQVALRLLDKTTPDLILSDIAMPTMNGIMFYQTLRQNPRWISIPFMFLTAHGNPDDVSRGRELGVEDYIIKPFDQSKLIRIIQARLSRFTQVQVSMVNQAYLDTVNVLAKTIEGRDPYTHGHVERVACYARWLAESLNWHEDHLRWLEFGARLHDVGKIIIPDHVLKKSGPLTRDEWTLMRQHPASGAKILQEITFLHNVIPYVLYHHEHWDGTGYPYGLRGRDLPLEGRIMAIADVYDALTTPRPYRLARPHDEVIDYMQRKAGSYFDPDLIYIFIQVIENRRKAMLN